ncbi:hypothetical protein [Bartonella sp. B30(2025)]
MIENGPEIIKIVEKLKRKIILSNLFLQSKIFNLLSNQKQEAETKFNEQITKWYGFQMSKIL